MHELASLQVALAAYRPRRHRLRHRLTRAAVALIVRETRQGGEVFLVQRARRKGDPWSGDMALPGGRVDAADEASASAAACRETAEEIGLEIERNDGIGRLSDRLTVNHRRRGPMIVSPFVYRPESLPAPTLNHEIRAIRWVPLAWLDEPSHRTTLRWPVGPLALPMPCYDCGNEQYLWGLTLRMLDELLNVWQARQSA